MTIADARAHAARDAAQRPRRLQRLAELATLWQSFGPGRRDHETEVRAEILGIVEDLTMNDDSGEIGTFEPFARAFRVEDRNDLTRSPSVSASDRGANKTRAR